jgi:predicted nucleic acid-binding protein
LNLVLDASMTMAWLFDDERRPETEIILHRVASDGAIAPPLWRLEVASALRLAIRGMRIDRRYAERCFDRLGRLPIGFDEESDRHAWGRIWELSNEHGLTPYDAAYLELALRRHLPLASCDKALIRAARTAGVNVLAE